MARTILARHVYTVGDLRRLLEPFTDETSIVIERQETGEDDSGPVVEYEFDGREPARLILS